MVNSQSPHTPAGLIPANWPFNPAKSPFYYGWVIWFFSTLGFVFSVPGQTMGMAVFTDPFITAFELTRTQLSTAYFIGTVGSALLLRRAGLWYDRLGARVMIVASSLLLAGVVLIISQLDLISAYLANALDWQLALITFPAITLCYFGVRFSGQGVLTSASRNVLLVWFERRRGLVSGVRGVFVSLAFSIAPLFLAWLIDTNGWRLALIILASLLGLGFASLALVFIRDNPEASGLQIDGGVLTHHAKATPTPQPQFIASDAFRSRVFWIYSFGLSIHALFGTALTFHIVDIFAEAERSRASAFAYFLPSAIVATSVNLFASWLADRHQLKPFLVAMLGAFVLGAWGLLHLNQTWGFWLLVAGFGAGGGLWGVISNLAFVRFFGSAHLGEISGLNTAITVFASAIGPLMFSLSRDYFDTYAVAIGFCTVSLIVLLVAAMAIKQPRH